MLEEIVMAWIGARARAVWETCMMEATLDQWVAVSRFIGEIGGRS